MATPTARARPAGTAESRAGAAAGTASFGLHDPALLALLALVLVLQLATWRALDGYQIADSVEYLERARTLVRGESMVDANTIRPIGFSALLVPFFVVAEWFGCPDPRAIVWSTYLLQIALGLCLVHRVARIGAQLGGRTAGWIAGFVVGANPIFLQYSAQAESGIAASLCIALGVERLMEKDARARDVWIGAAWLGGSFLIAYKAVGLLLGIGLVLVVRDRWRARRNWIAVWSCLALAIVVQSLTDLAMYGTFGASVRKYFVENIGAVLTSSLKHLRFGEASARVYEIVELLKGNEAYVRPADAASMPAVARQPPEWYFTNLPQMFVWPVLVCLLLGIARVLFRANWRTTFLFAPCLVFVLATSSKGSKDYRLWIPMLAVLAPLAAYGAVWALDALRSRNWRRTWLAVLVAPSVVLGLAGVLALDTRHFRGYWRAIDAANVYAHTSRGARAPVPGNAGTPEKLRVGSAYNWAVYMRESAEVELVKLPLQLNAWKVYTDTEKARDLAALEELDVFITHQPMIASYPDLMAWVSEHYEVLEMFYERDVHADLGPIYLLGRRTSRATAARFFEQTPDADVETFRAARALPTPTEFAARAADGRVERLVYLGSELRTLPPDDFGWITYHWYTPTGISRDLTLVDRLTSLDERNTWQNDHAGAWGAHPTSAWRAGEIVSESYPLVPATSPFDGTAPWRPIGGAYRRGERIPVRLWMQVVERDVTDASVAKTFYTPVRAGTEEPLPALAPAGTEELPQPYPLAADGLLRVGAFFVPVHPLAQLADDGRPVPD